MRGKFSLDTLAKTRLLEQAKQKESSLIVTLLVTVPKYGFAEHPFN
jgi:glutamyl-tRNA reductase